MGSERAWQSAFACWAYFLSCCLFDLHRQVSVGSVAVSFMDYFYSSFSQFLRAEHCVQQGVLSAPERWMLPAGAEGSSALT